MRAGTFLDLLSVTYERHRSLFQSRCTRCLHLTQHLGVNQILCGISHQGDFVYVIVTYDLQGPYAAPFVQSLDYWLGALSPRAVPSHSLMPLCVLIDDGEHFLPKVLLCAPNHWAERGSFCVLKMNPHTPLTRHRAKQSQTQQQLFSVLNCIHN